jgi:protein-S-isoprenylcysteine O-methyltransferase Ste14
VKLKALVGSGDRIGLFTLPFLLAGVALNVAFPAAFAVGGPPPLLAWVSVVVFAVGVVVWAWSVVLILRDVPRGRLITSGPFAVVRHPLYTGVALLVLPWAGFLLNTWLGAVLGIVLFAGARMFEGGEERALASRFGSDWDRYAAGVKIAWL